MLYYEYNYKFPTCNRIAKTPEPFLLVFLNKIGIHILFWVTNNENDIFLTFSSSIEAYRIMFLFLSWILFIF